MSLLRISPFFAPLLLSACASVVTPGASDLVLAPETFSAAPAELDASPSDWIAAFEDPVLQVLVAEALDANPTVASALASYDAARAGARSAGAARLPTLDGSVGYTDQEPGNTGFSTGLEVNWQADVWGRLGDQARSGALTAEAARADWYGARLSIAASVARSWYALIAASQQAELAQADVEARTNQLEIVERRFQRGVVRSSDVRTARSALASSEATLASRLRAQANAARVLEVTLGRYPSASIAAGAELPALGALPNPGQPETLLARRPDVVAAQARLAAAGYSASAAQKALYPGLGLRASLADGGADIADALNFDDLVKTVVGSISAPIFQGGRLRAERDRAEAQAEQLSANLVSTALTALREAEDAIEADRRLAQRVDALTVASDEAREALALVQRQYASGLSTIFELIDAQTRQISAQSALISARNERVDNRIALHLAIAGDFSAGGGVTASNIEN
ncbi:MULTISPECIES: TolC family protein [unclassified Oceanicaulis]|uniref:efflux transporter outer membrane subunit n=1 Tax=unclassified Oceanicaulis TaxID=2632123 RepID=UPI0025EF52F9|nr:MULTISPECIES: TolC family protein [unclassified Oceanicaulis]